MRQIIEQLRVWMCNHPKRALVLIFAAGFLLNSILFAGVARADHSDVKVGASIRLYQVCEELTADRLIALWRTVKGDPGGAALAQALASGRCIYVGHVMGSRGMWIEALEVSGPIKLGNGEWVWRVVAGIDGGGTKWITLVPTAPPHSA